MTKMINKDRITKRGEALMGVYIKNRKVVPDFSVFVNDYFKIVDSGKTNQTAVKETAIVLKGVYDKFNKAKNPRVAIVLV